MNSEKAQENCTLAAVAAVARAMIRTLRINVQRVETLVAAMAHSPRIRQHRAQRILARAVAVGTRQPETLLVPVVPAS